MIERRYTTTPNRVGIETRSDGKVAIVGYASVWFNAADPGTEYQLYPDVFERIMPGAFDRAIREDDVRRLFNHNPDNILGRTSSKTLRLSVDDVGLRYEIDPPDTVAGASVVEAIRRGDISGSSFSFDAKLTTYREEKRGDKTVVIVERDAVGLFDVSPVTFPAYGAASVGLRADGSTSTVLADVAEWKADRAAFRTMVDASARAVEVCLGIASGR